jgi:biopolymer transport protein ExbD
MRFQRHYSIIKGQLNLTPLIDVIFLQLIYFMLTSSFIMQPGIKINLPQAATAETMAEKEVVVGISEEGVIFFKDRPVTLAQLEKFLQDALAKNAGVTLIVQGDKKTEHGTVVAVMDTARKKGISKIAIATIPDF